jgi:hypothetical protein
MKDLSTALNFHRRAGDLRRQEPRSLGRRPHANYTGLSNFTFGFNFDYGSAGQ